MRACMYVYKINIYKKICYLSPAKAYSATAICNVSRIMQSPFPFIISVPVKNDNPLNKSVTH